MQVATNPSGYNSGRNYNMRTKSKETYDEVLHLLSKLSKAARRRAEGSTLFRKTQMKVRKICEQHIFQSVIAAIIVGVSTFPLLGSVLHVLTRALSFQSFLCTIMEAQYSGALVNADGSSTSLGALLDRLNFAFTIIFALELAVNAYSLWLIPFFTNPWSWLDIFVVSMSILSLVVTDDHTGMVRVMRALRVLRLLGRFRALRKIISALSSSIVPVVNAFMILFTLACICEPHPSSRPTRCPPRLSPPPPIRPPPAARRACLSGVGGGRGGGGGLRLQPVGAGQLPGLRRGLPHPLLRHGRRSLARHPPQV